jgi:hypothetical protein
MVVELSWAVGRRGTVVVDGGGAGAVVTDNEALALHHGGEKEKEVGSRMTENRRGWWLTERANGGGDAAGIQWGVALQGWCRWEGDAGFARGVLGVRTELGKGD